MRVLKWASVRVLQKTGKGIKKLASGASHGEWCLVLGGSHTLNRVLVASGQCKH